MWRSSTRGRVRRAARRQLQSSRTCRLRRGRSCCGSRTAVRPTYWVRAVLEHSCTSIHTSLFTELVSMHYQAYLSLSPNKPWTSCSPAEPLALSQPLAFVASLARTRASIPANCLASNDGGERLRTQRTQGHPC